MVSTFIGYFSYAIVLGTISLGLEEFLRKRDEEFKDKRRMKIVFAGLILMGVLNFMSLYHDNHEKEQKEQKAEREITTLQKKVDLATQAQKTAIKAQKDNTDIFATKFVQLSKEVSDLQRQVTTANLQKKLANVQAELQKTERAMAPAPKAKLEFSFYPFINPAIHEGQPIPAAQLVKDVNLPISVEDVVHVEFTVVNLTETVAQDIAVSLSICGFCKFATEPQGFTVVPGSNRQTERQIIVNRLRPLEALSPLSVDVLLPPGAPAFKIGFIYRCETCVTEIGPKKGKVHIIRDLSLTRN